MNALIAIPEFLVNEILSVPAFLIGIITAVGLGAMGKKTGQVLGGAIKATLGFLLIGAGASLVVASLEPLGIMIQGATGAHGVVPTNEAIVGIAQNQFGGQVAWLMILGFAISLTLARITPMSYVFLTGHHVLFMATMLTMVLAAAGFGPWVVVPVGALLLGILMVSLPAIAHPWTRRVTGDDSIAIGHFGTAGYVAAGAVGKLVGGKKESMSASTEELKLPEGLRFLRDSMVATALSMALMYVVLAILFILRAGQDEAFTAFNNGATSVGNYLMQSVTQGLQFGVAVAVILFGVRTILGELVPAFQGIAAKVVPGAIPALDAPHRIPLRTKRSAHRLYHVLRGRPDRPRSTLRLAQPSFRRSTHPARTRAALLHRRHSWRIRQCDRRPTRCRTRRPHQRFNHHIPASIPAGRFGQLW
ncbi:hypothetical protein FRC0405_02237 [Corynebacterium diphtheriae]|nr:hypothetical protein FRC0405_02237 [Corynebacterium diphtheriae]